MSDRKSFTERFEEMLGVALLRHGMVTSRREYGSWVYDEAAYKTLGLKSRVGQYGMREYDSLSKARCPKCHCAMQVIDVRDDVYYGDWTGTFSEPDNFTHAAGKMVCPREPQKHARFDVVMDGTLGEAVHYLDDIANELGY